MNPVEVHELPRGNWKGSLIFNASVVVFVVILYLLVRPGGVSERISRHTILHEVHPGMGYDEVIKVIGMPVDQHCSVECEPIEVYWVYQSDRGFFRRGPVTVMFKGGRVAGFLE